MTMQVIDKPSYPGMILHPAQHKDQFVIGEMMAEQGWEKDIGLSVVKLYVPVIWMDPMSISFFPSFFCHPDTKRIIIDTRYFQVNTPLPAPPAQYPQVISATAANLTNGYAPPVTYRAYEVFQTLYTYGMTTEPGIDKIQLLHIPLNIRKRDIIPVQQLFFKTSLWEIGFASHIYIR
jgi:hypothetical protein